MNKILKNLHWFIIAYAFVNIYLGYVEKEEQLTTLQANESTQQDIFRKNKKEQKAIQSFYKNIDEEKVKIERVAQEIEKMQQILPSEVSDTENIELVRGMAEEVNVKEISISPDKEEDHGFYIIRNYKISAKATYLQFLILFEKISENKRILNIGEINFSKTQEVQRGKFETIHGDFVIHAYRYNAKFREDRGIEELEKKFKEEKKSGKAKNEIFINAYFFVIKCFFTRR
jgi:Tfp pilus assembly protein PilO